MNVPPRMTGNASQRRSASTAYCAGNTLVSMSLMALLSVPIGSGLTSLVGAASE